MNDASPVEYRIRIYYPEGHHQGFPCDTLEEAIAEAEEYAAGASPGVEVRVERREIPPWTVAAVFPGRKEA